VGRERQGDGNEVWSALIIWPWTPMINVLQAKCRASEDIMTVLMSESVRVGVEVVLIQKPTVKQEKDKWKVKIQDRKYVNIYSGDNDILYVLTAVRNDRV
jgi:hypothetical protein